MSSAVSPFTICMTFTDSGSRGSKKRTSPLTLWEWVVVMLGGHTGAPGCTTCSQGPSTRAIQGHGPGRPLDGTCAHPTDSGARPAAEPRGPLPTGRKGLAAEAHSRVSKDLGEAVSYLFISGRILDFA